MELEKIRRNKLIQSTNAKTEEKTADPEYSGSPSASSVVIESYAKSHDFEEVKTSTKTGSQGALSRQNSSGIAQQKTFTYAKQPSAKEMDYNDSDDEGVGNLAKVQDYPSTVKIALVESIITSPLDRERYEGKFSPREEEEGFCVVEYESDA